MHARGLIEVVYALLHERAVEYVKVEKVKQLTNIFLTPLSVIHLHTVVGHMQMQYLTTHVFLLIEHRY